MDNAFFNLPRERTDFSDRAYGALGRALTYATAFEAACRALSSLHFVRDRVRIASQTTHDADEAFAIAVGEIWSRRLHKHLKNIFRNQQYPDDTADAIKAAKSARNEIAHELTLGLSHTIETELGNAGLLTRVSHLARTIAKGYAIIEVTALAETCEAVPVHRSISEYATKVAEWIVER